MKKWLSRIVVVAVLAGLGVWAWQAFFPKPEKAIRKRLTELAELASFRSNEAPAAKLWNSQKLVTFFTGDVEIMVNAPGYQGTLSGRDALLQAVMGIRQHLSALSVEVHGIQPTVAPDGQSAVANLTIKGKIPSDADNIVQELKVSFKKTGGDWLISRVETMKTLR